MEFISDARNLEKWILDQIMYICDNIDLEELFSSGMLHRVALVRTDVSEEPCASFIRVTRIGELGTT
jgi:hypothetical protein